MMNEKDILDYDPFEGDETDVVRLRNVMVTCRKGGPCQLCEGEIQPGERIRSITEINREDNKIATFRFCAECCQAMALTWEDGGDALTERHNLRRQRE